jgi:hypothetical protein
VSLLERCLGIDVDSASNGNFQSKLRGKKKEEEEKMMEEKRVPTYSLT